MTEETESFVETVSNISFNDDSITNSITSNSSDTSGNSTGTDMVFYNVNKYDLIYEIATGGYSSVYISYNNDDKKFYAVKIHRRKYYKEAFKEIEFYKKHLVNAKNICKMHEYFIKKYCNRDKYICSIWDIYACDTYKLIKTTYTTGFPMAIFIPIIKQITYCLFDLHAKLNIIHCDVKPENILLSGINTQIDKICKDYLDKLNNQNMTHEDIVDKLNSDYEIKYIIDGNNVNAVLTDFGSTSVNNKVNSFFGTKYYMPPEYIISDKISYPIDIWALGCSLFELLTGEVLFDPQKTDTMSTEHMHLCLMQDACGLFDKRMIERCKDDSYFKKNRLIRYKKNKDPLYNGLINKENIPSEQLYLIIKDMLILDPNKRIDIRRLKTLVNDNFS